MVALQSHLLENLEHTQQILRSLGINFAQAVEPLKEPDVRKNRGEKCTVALPEIGTDRLFRRPQ